MKIILHNSIYQIVSESISISLSFSVDVDDDRIDSTYKPAQFDTVSCCRIFHIGETPDNLPG